MDLLGTGNSLLFNPECVDDGNKYENALCREEKQWIRRRWRAPSRPFMPYYTVLEDAGAKYVRDSLVYQINYPFALSIGQVTHNPRPWVNFRNGNESPNAWDGSIFETTGKTFGQCLEWLYPGSSADLTARVSGRPLRGLLNLYDTTRPFKIEVSPTVEEVERWDQIVLNHFRKMIGRPPIEVKRSLMLKVMWNLEQRRTGVYGVPWNDLSSVPDARTQLKYLQPHERHVRSSELLKSSYHGLSTSRNGPPPASLTMSGLILASCSGGGGWPYPVSSLSSEITGIFLELVQRAAIGYCLHRTLPPPTLGILGSVTYEIGFY